jgi:hypothetical protein
VCAGELAGVVVVGTLSLVVPLHDRCVWSTYGLDYALVPLILPGATLLTLRQGSHRPTSPDFRPTFSQRTR